MVEGSSTKPLRQTQPQTGSQAQPQLLGSCIGLHSLEAKKLRSLEAQKLKKELHFWVTKCYTCTIMQEVSSHVQLAAKERLVGHITTTYSCFCCCCYTNKQVKHIYNASSFFPQQVPRSGHNRRIEHTHTSCSYICIHAIRVHKEGLDGQGTDMT